MSKKILAFVIVCMTLLTSSRYITPGDAREGTPAPSLSVGDDNHSLSLEQLRGAYVLVTFWSSVNPESRMACKQHDLAAASSPKLHHLAVNLDRSKGLFDQLVVADQLHSESQFHLDADRHDEVTLAWRQQQGAYSSFLIDPDGKIAKVNPTDADLAQI